MIKFIGRTVGFFLVAAGFVALIADGARAVANGPFIATPLVNQAVLLFPGHAAAWLRGAEQHLPAPLWQWAVQPVLAWPAFAVLIGLGLALLYLSRPGKPLIGYAPRP